MTTPRSSSPASVAAIVPQCTFVQHVALRSTDLERARRFYVDALGLPLLMETAELFVVLAGQTSLAIHGPAPATAGPGGGAVVHAGLEHLVLGCDGEDELARVAGALAAHGVDSTGIRTDEVFGRRSVAFRDPDGVHWELTVT